MRAFYSRVTTYANQSLQQCYVSKENEKKRKYKKRVMNLEQWCFVEWWMMNATNCEIYKISENVRLRPLKKGLINIAWKVPKSFFWSVFSSEYSKIWTRKNSVFGHFSGSRMFKKPFDKTCMQGSVFCKTGRRKFWKLLFLVAQNSAKSKQNNVYKIVWMKDFEPRL